MGNSTNIGIYIGEGDKDIAAWFNLLQRHHQSRSKWVCGLLAAYSMGKPLQIGVLTSNYHLYRAMQIGKKNGFASLSGVSASSDPVLFVHFCVRESLAILKDKFMGNM